VTPSPLLLLFGREEMRKIVRFVPGKDNKPIARFDGTRGKVILPCRGWTPRVGEEWEVELEERDRYFIAYPVQPQITIKEICKEGEYYLATTCGSVLLKEEKPKLTEKIVRWVGTHLSGLIYVEIWLYHYFDTKKCDGHRDSELVFDDISNFLSFVEKNQFLPEAKEKALSLIAETIRNWEKVEGNLHRVAELFMFDPSSLAPYMYSKPLCDEWKAETHLSHVLKEVLSPEYSPLTDVVANYLLEGIPQKFPPSQDDVRKALKFYSIMNLRNVEKTFQEVYGLELLSDWGGFFVKFDSQEELYKHFPSLRPFTLKEPTEVDGKWIVWLTELRLY